MITALIVIAVVVIPAALVFVLDALCAAIGANYKNRQWVRAMHEVVRTDSRMLNDAFRLSLAHFRAVNELRKLGDRR